MKHRGIIYSFVGAALLVAGIVTFVVWNEPAAEDVGPLCTDQAGCLMRAVLDPQPRFANALAPLSGLVLASLGFFVLAIGLVLVRQNVMATETRR